LIGILPNVFLDLHIVVYRVLHQYVKNDKITVSRLQIIRLLLD